MNDVRIAALHVYPVKSCRGLALTQAAVAVTGLGQHGAGDREWMVVDGDGRFVTQREFPRLALVGIALSASHLQLSAPHAALLPVEIPLARAAVHGDALRGNATRSRDVVVWRSDVGGFDEGDDAATWLQAYLQADVRLVRFDAARPRACNPEFAGDSGAHTMFADGYPVLVVGQPSLADLNARLSARGCQVLPMNRFRPNVVLDGLDPYAEDHIDTIESNGIVLKCVKPCTRCQVTTTDQFTAQTAIEPLRTLGEYRMNEELGGVMFGANAIVVAGAGHTLTQGAAVTVNYRF
jgi:uncharacterized protein